MILTALEGRSTEPLKGHVGEIFYVVRKTLNISSTCPFRGSVQKSKLWAELSRVE